MQLVALTIVTQKVCLCLFKTIQFVANPCEIGLEERNLSSAGDLRKLNISY